MMNDSLENSLVTTVVFRDDARKCLLSGMKIAAEAIGCTLGPSGKTVLIQKADGAPIVTKDGVTVSKSIKLKNKLQRMGSELIKEAASRTNDVAGDGTTTSSILTYALVREGMKVLGNGYAVAKLNVGMRLGADFIVSYLAQNLARQIDTTNEIQQVATVSANGDINIGNLISQAMDRVGKNGVITVEDAKGMSTSLEVVEGMQFDRGYLSPYFVNNTEKMHASYENCRILITDKKLNSFNELIPLLEQALRIQQPLLIVADDVDNEALQALVMNRVKGNMPVVAIKAPSYGINKDNVLNDMCVMTGTKLVSSKTGLTLKDVKFEQLGACKRVVVTQKSTVIVGAAGKKDEISSRIDELDSQLSDVTLSAEEILLLRNRIANMTNGIAVIHVGGATELEMIERKYRIEDALHATRAAAEEGIVVGGGMALLRASMALCDTLGAQSDGDIRSGMEIVVRACREPFKAIIRNTGVHPDIVLNDLIDDINFGYNAATGKHVNMWSEGIIDPVKVTRLAVQNATSVAMTFLTLDAAIFEDDDRDTK